MRRNKGFTAVEIIIGLTILALIAALAISAGWGWWTREKEKNAVSLASNIDIQKKRYLTENNSSALAAWSAATSDQERYALLRSNLTNAPAEFGDGSADGAYAPVGYKIVLNGLNEPATVIKVEDNSTVTNGGVSGNSFIISTSSSNSTMGTALGGGSYGSGETVTLAAQPFAGYSFVRWTEGGSSITNDASFSFSANASRSFLAEFQAAPEGSYTLTVLRNNTMGGTVTPPSGTHASGDVVSVSASPNSGWIFDSWSGDIGSASASSSSISVTMAQNRTVQANFVRSSVTLSLAPNDPVKGGVAGGGTVPSGTTTTITATPYPGFRFLGWLNGVTTVSVASSYTLTVNSDVSLTAQFDVEPSTGVTPGTYGSANKIPKITIDAQGRVMQAEPVDIAVPNTQVTGLGTMSTQNSGGVAITGGTASGVNETGNTETGNTENNPIINGGAANGMTIGGTSPSSGNFTQIGIGTTAPTKLLHVVSPELISARFQQPGSDQSGIQIDSGTPNALWQAYIPSAGTDLRFWNGSDVLSLLRSGNVGIGTNSPSAKLEVAGAMLSSGNRPIRVDGTTGNIFIQGDTGGWANYLHFRGSSGTDRGGFGALGGADTLNYLYAGQDYSNPTMVWRGGNVGVGTTTPGYKMDVAGDVNITGQFRVNGVPFSGSSQWSNNGANIYYNLGNVGIGTSSPGARLSLGTPADGSKSLALWENGSAFFGFGNGPNQVEIHAGPVGDTAKMVINANGNVGVGTTSATYKLDVAGTTNSSIGFVSVGNPWGTANSAFFPNGITTAGATNWIYGDTYIGNAPTNGSGHSFNANGAAVIGFGAGFVGVGTMSPQDKLHVSAGDGSFARFGSNALGASLRVGSGLPSVNATTASITVTDGNLHIDSANGHNLHLNYYNNNDTFININGGNVGVGGWNSSQKLTVTGNIKAFGDIYADRTSNEGGAVRIQNPSKTGANVSEWAIYNMTGGYGNGLKFWRYPANGVGSGSVFDIMDDGSVVIPSGSLTVSGGFTASGRLRSTGIDLPGTNATTYDTHIPYGGDNNVYFRNPNVYVDHTLRVGGMLTIPSDQWVYTTDGHIRFHPSANGANHFSSPNGLHYFRATDGNYKTYIADDGVHMQKSLFVSTDSTTGGGIVFADDGDIVDLNDAWATHRFSYGLHITSANRGGGTQIQLANSNGGHTWFNTGNNFGIGNTNPTAKLEVTGDAASNALIVASTGSAGKHSIFKMVGQPTLGWGSYPGAYTPAIQIQNNDNSRFIWLSPLDSASGSNAILRTGQTGLNIYSGGTLGDIGSLGFSQDIAGNVGIGTASPTAKFDVNGSIKGRVTRGSYGALSIVGSANGYSGIDFQDASQTLMVRSDGLSGMYRNDSTWLWGFDQNGTMTWGSVPWGRLSGVPAIPAGNWYYSGQGGQPTWLWGTNDGSSHYVWNPSNFVVNNVNDLRGTWDSLSYFRSNRGGGSYLKDHNSAPLEVYSSDGGTAFMSFHRGGYFAVNMGLDPDNVLRIGGWSMAPNRWQLDGNGNQTLGGQSTINGNYRVSNYGQGLVGVYDSYKYQGVFAMGDSYKVAEDGSTPGNLYGIAWTHSNAGGQSKAGLSHQALFMINGYTATAIGDGIWTRGNVGIKRDASYPLDVQGTVRVVSGDFRTSGSGGWYAEDYGGGWYMSDSTWIRSYGEKNTWLGGGWYGTNGGLTIGYGGGTGSNAGGGAIIAGNVGIGTSSPAYKLDVAGDVRASNFYATSSRRFKDNILPLNSAETLQKVLALQGASYDWKPGMPRKGHDIGLIAEEVDKIFPEFVAHEGGDRSKPADGVAYEKLSAVLVESIKALKTENDQLRAKGDAQQLQISSFVLRMENYEKALACHIANGTEQDSGIVSRYGVIILLSAMLTAITVALAVVIRKRKQSS